MVFRRARGRAGGAGVQVSTLSFDEFFFLCFETTLEAKIGGVVGWHIIDWWAQTISAVIEP